MGVFCLFFGIFRLFFTLILSKIYIYATKKRIFMNKNAFLVGRGGFEPPKSKTSDLQSDPFGRSGICPCVIQFFCGAGDWTRTHNLLITNQLLCQLSYTGRCWCLGAESNHRQADFQSAALPTELPRHLWRPRTGSNRRPPA